MACDVQGIFHTVWKVIHGAVDYDREPADYADNRSPTTHDRRRPVPRVSAPGDAEGLARRCSPGALPLSRASGIDATCVRRLHRRLVAAWVLAPGRAPLELAFRFSGPYVGRCSSDLAARISRSIGLLWLLRLRNRNHASYRAGAVPVYDVLELRAPQSSGPASLEQHLFDGRLHRPARRS